MDYKSFDAFLKLLMGHKYCLLYLVQPADKATGKVSIQHLRWTQPQLDVICVPVISWGQFFFCHCFGHFSAVCFNIDIHCTVYSCTLI